MTLCVYALTADARPGPGVRGLAGERLRLVTEGPLAAMIGRLPAPPPPSIDNLRRYDRTLRALAARLPAVLPARFGTCFESLDDLTFVLRSRRRTLAKALAHVRGRAQMTVRLAGAPQAAASHHGPGEPPPPGPAAAARPGTAYLRQRAAAAARDRHVPEFAPLRAAVRRSIRDERVERRAGVTTVYHLVPRAAAEAYRTRMERAAAAAGLQVIVSGPWPAYAFAGFES